MTVESISYPEDIQINSILSVGNVRAFHENIDISDIILQETEVIDVRWVTKRGLIRMAQNGELHPLFDIGNVVNEVI